MKKIILITLFAVTSFSIYSQTYSFKGKLIDTENMPLIGANVLLLDDKDETKFVGSTDVDGIYLIENVKSGAYRIKISYIGYFSVFKDVEVNKNIDYGTTTMYESAIGLDEVVVEGKVPLALQKGDTTSYAASQYKVLADASTEDLVAKMPGVTLENGTIKAQGENVQQVLVDGKPFFGGDASAALKNLPADVVDRIEIFDKKSEQSEFTGFDDGETAKTINIVTKIDSRAGQFGKGYAAYGTENHYNLGGNFSLFNGDQRISFIGQLNDINIQNFSSEDILGVSGSSGRGGRGGRGGGGGRGSNEFQIDQSGGISTTRAFGVNFSDQWGPKAEITMSYFVNNSSNLSIESIQRQFFEAESAVNEERYIEDKVGNSNNMNHRFNGRLEYKFSKQTSINFRPSLSYQSSDGFTETSGETKFAESLINNTENNYDALNKGWNINNNATLRHSFGASKRTISLDVRNSYNNNIGNSSLYSLNKYFEPLLDDQKLDQISTLDQIGWNNSANVSYTEPVGEKGMLSVEYRITLENEDSNLETFNADESGVYNKLDNLLSSVFKNDYTTHAGGLAYNYRLGKSMIMARASLQYSKLFTDQTFPIEDELERTFLNVIPFVMWRYSVDRQNNIRVIYRTNTRKPSLSQLQEVVNNTNPLQLSIGNAALDQQFQHSIFARLSRANTEKGTVMYALVGGNITQDYIGNSLYTSRSDNEFVKSLNLSPGTQINQTVNLKGYWDFRTFLTFGLPVYPLKSNLNLNLSANFSNTPGLINDEPNKALASTFGLGLVLSSNISEKIDFSIGSNTSYNNVTNNINSNQNTKYINQTSTVKLNWILPAEFVFRTDINNQLYTGLSEGFNENYWIWNLAIGKKVFKNKLGEVNISVYDLLNQNQRISRVVTGNYIEDGRTNILQRYVMVNFIYNFRNFKTAKKGIEKSDEDSRGDWERGRGF